VAAPEAPVAAVGGRRVFPSAGTRGKRVIIAGRATGGWWFAMATMTRERRYQGQRVGPSEGDFMLESGYAIEKLIGGLTYPTDVEITPEGDVYFAEAGFTYPYVFTMPRVCRLTEDGGCETIATEFTGPVVGLAWHDGSLLVTHRGALARVTRDGLVVTLVDGLPAWGDHHTNHIVVEDGHVYFGQGAATNAGVVGVDNLIPYGWLEGRRDVHDIPPFDVALTGLDFTSRDPFNVFETVRTGPFHSFGSWSMPGEVVAGSLKANSVVYRCDPDGGGLDVFCWGLRNPYALALSPDGRLWTIDQGGDDRGSRPLASKDALYEVRQGAWYGFPDWLGGHPAPLLAENVEIDNPGGFVMQDHPTRTPPVYLFPEEHCAATQLDFSRNEDFGYFGQAFVTEYGSGAPATTGGHLLHAGQRVVRIEMDTMSSTDFYRNENPGIGGSGPERPVALRFSPDGTELYLVDHGRFGVPRTGALWRITPA
jgi:glucose/arabinose dehydrogenase